VLVFGAIADFQVYGSGRWFDAQTGDEDDQYQPYGIAGVDDEAYRAMTSNPQYRVVMLDSARAEATTNRIWGVNGVEGSDPFITYQYTKVVEKWTPFYTTRAFHADVLNEQMMQALAIRYVMVRSGSEHAAWVTENPNFRLIGREKIFCRVYEYVHAIPDYRMDDPAARVQALAWTPERREFRVQSPHGGRMELVEQFFPGWQAEVDGKPVSVELYGGAFQAIALPAGEHRVTFEFRPASLAIGGVLSLLAWAGLLVVARPALVGLSRRDGRGPGAS